MNRSRLWQHIWHIGLLGFTATGLLWGHRVIHSVSIEWEGVFSDAGLMRLYLSDVFFLFALAGGIGSGVLRRALKTVPVMAIVGFAVLLIAGSSPLFMSNSNQILAVHGLLRLVQGGVIALFIIAVCYWHRSILRYLFGIVVAVGVLHSVVGVIQVASGASIGGLLYYIGEPHLSLDMYGIAKVMVSNETTLLRAYGLLPHANVLGGVLVGTLAVSFATYVRWKQTMILRVVLLFGIAIQSAGLLLTFSRSAWMSVVLGGIVGIGIWKRSLFVPIGAIVCGVAAMVMFPTVRDAVVVRSDISPTEQYTEERVQFSEQALALWKEEPLFGVGAGQTVPESIRRFPNVEPWQHTHVHAVPLVVLVEHGIVGIIGAGSILLIAIWGVWRTKGGRRGIAVLAITLIPLLFLDHYLWTQQPGRIILWAIVGCMYVLRMKYVLKRKRLNKER